MNSQKFNGNRLKDARIFRGKSISSLSEECQITKQTLSQYENGSIKPEPNKLFTLSCALNFPIDYFYTEDTYSIEVGTTYFRSLLSTSKIDRSAQSKRLEFLAKIFDVLCEHIDFPILNIPSIRFSGTQDENKRLQEIESIATQLRKYWNLGDGPIKELKYTLESNGIIVTGFRDVNSAIDAFSQQIRVNEKMVYIIALATGMKPIERLRFDMAHELGHILMHSWGEDNEYIGRDEFNAREKQANMFAGAFLLPKDSFVRTVAAYPTNVDYYRFLKDKWKVSMQAMMYRARQLNVISANQFQYMMRIVSRKGWRTKEPGDVPGQLGETIFQGAIDLLFDGGYMTVDELLREFASYGIVLSQEDLENFMCLRTGTLKQTGKIIPFMSVKKDNQ